MSSKVPSTLKPIAHYIKIANENASRDPIIYYWSLFYAVQNAMQFDKSSPEALQYITGLLTTLEAIKKQLNDNEAIKNETVAQAHIEDYALKLFNFADKKEKNGEIDKAVVHAFYTAGHIMDILSLFGEVDEPFLSSKKYAKWKSTQIFACLRDGTPYVSSNQPEKTVDDELADFGQQFQPHDPSSTSERNFDNSNRSSEGGVPIGFTNVPSGPQPPIRTTIPPPLNPYQFSNQVPVAPMPNASSNPQPPSVPSSSQPPAEVFAEIKKLTKYALSAIDYEDTLAVRDNLSKALAILNKY